MQSEAYRGIESIRLDQRVARAGPGMETTPVDPVLEFLGAWQPAEESSAPTGGLGGGK